jgi:ArsR family transcriptional regulator, arsenate/arsenite/antimonite-responsive transcriptional repressor
LSTDICFAAMLTWPAVSKIQKPVDMEKLFWVLADRTRLRLLNLIGDDEVCVCFLVEILGVSQPTVSRHLAHLRRAGIVGARREGKWMHYRIDAPDHPNAARVLEEVQAWVARDPQMQRDRKRLVKVCCAPELPVQLQGAPRPASVVLG